MIKLYKDILELKTWIREEEGAKAEGKGQFGKIHSEKQLMDLIYKFNTEKKKNINVLWFNQGVRIEDGKVLADAKVIITNGVEVMEELTTGLGEEKRSDISFGLGKALTYGKRFWLQKFLDLSSDDIDPEHISNKNTKQVVKKVVKQASTTTTTGELATYKSGSPVKSKDGVHLTTKQYSNAIKISQADDRRVWEIDSNEL